MLCAYSACKSSKKNVYLQSRTPRHAYAEENRRPGLPQHRLPGTLVLPERELHQRQQRRRKDQPDGRDLLSVDDQERLPGPRPLQLALRDGRVHHRRHVCHGQRPGIPFFHQGLGRGEEAGPRRQALHPHLRTHRRPSRRHGLPGRHRPRERFRRGAPPFRQRRPVSDGPELSRCRPDV